METRSLDPSFAVAAESRRRQLLVWRLAAVAGFTGVLFGQALVVTPTETARAPVAVPAEDRAREPVVEPLMVTQKRDAIRDRQVAEGDEPPA